MVRELYQIATKEISINVVQSKIDSVRVKDITKSGCRVFEGGFIGVAGTYGEPTDDTWAEAERNLELEIPYDMEPEGGKTRERRLAAGALTNEQVIENTEKILETLRREYPDFIFSNKVNYSVIRESLKNDRGLDYVNEDCAAMLALLFKPDTSVNIFDGILSLVSREYDVEKFLQNARNQLDGYRREAELPQGEHVTVALGRGYVGSKLAESLNGEALGRGVSMFCGKMGEQVFSEELSVKIDLGKEQSCISFFDGEGSTLDGDSIYLIERGKILRGYTDKKIGKEFGFENTAAAGGAYDDVPSLNGCNYGILEFEKSDKTIEELTGGEEFVYVDVASGGDWTNSGDFATPVQLGYLMRGDKVLGRLPEFSVSGNLYEMFGKDFIGYSKDKNLDGENVAVMRMKVSK